MDEPFNNASLDLHPSGSDSGRCIRCFELKLSKGVGSGSEGEALSPRVVRCDADNEFDTCITWRYRQIRSTRYLCTQTLY